MGIDGGRIWSGYGPDEFLQDVESKCFYAFHTGVAFGTERDILTVFLLLILTRVILGGSWGARSLSGGRWLRWVHDVDVGDRDLGLPCRSWELSIPSTHVLCLTFCDPIESLWTPSSFNDLHNLARHRRIRRQHLVGWTV